ncbi:ABC transporter substrate-binding protein [Candidatus Woesearchaeota archaeon]|jgi:branched-chain amino acid transport system substrate-binding protein|nr:ABC transporter substrate-binding protein [Candidatus Woesearchaeota archaeon]MBT4367992.1 ABC transporter substrate-binding protein [Candidatus Woesearchaeota archaeon]MBT4712480.1 ABC transporter substrate-binding protein [Candidatus Woesearchaeota archaeon]MBT6639393.1 ABC transporter substrate-binding protein [Candidatus Woesearchaeota archaeon]MBT7133565.1 ABC transporter substrate-binding protein [Candidatus Woesearchaeota archaeon]
MKKLITILLLLTLITLIGCNNQETIKLGVTLPLTGSLAFIGESSQEAMNLAAEEFNTNSDIKIELIFEDDMFEPSKAINNVNKLININDVNAIISLGSPVGTVIAPIAQENNILHVGIASADIATLGSLNFNHWTPPKSQAKKLVEKLNEDNITKISVITMNQEGGIAIRNEVFNELEKNNIRVLLEEKFTQGEKDFKTIWNKIKESDPEIVFFSAISPEFELILKQRIELGLDIPVVTIESPDYTDEPELYNDNWFINAAEPTEEFKDKFESEFGNAPRVFSGNAYDIVKVLGQIFVEKDNLIGSEIAATKLMELDQFKGAMGSFYVDSEGTFVTEAITKKMVDGKSITLE